MLHKGFAVILLFASMTVITGCLPNPDQEPAWEDQFSRPIRVACVGDSITYGSKIKNRETDCYPAQLGKMLGSKWEVKNFGVSGATMLKHGNRPYWDVALEKALKYEPDVVIIKLGTNDSKAGNWKHRDEFSSDCLEMIEAFEHTPGKPKICLCCPVPAYSERNISGKVVRDEIVPIIREVGQQKKLTIIDLYQALSDKPELFPDTVHPNAGGAKLISEEVYKTLKGKL